MAFGPELVAGLADMHPPHGFRGFSAIDGVDGFAAPITHPDLFVWLHGEARDELFARALAWRDALALFGLSDDARRDRLLGYSRPVSGSYFYAPPFDALRACLDG